MTIFYIVFFLIYTEDDPIRVETYVYLFVFPMNYNIIEFSKEI